MYLTYLNIQPNPKQAAAGGIDAPTAGLALTYALPFSQVRLCIYTYIF